MISDAANESKLDNSAGSSRENPIDIDSSEIPGLTMAWSSSLLRRGLDDYTEIPGLNYVGNSGHQPRPSSGVDVSPQAQVRDPDICTVSPASSNAQLPVDDHLRDIQSTRNPTQVGLPCASRNCSDSSSSEDGSSDDDSDNSEASNLIRPSVSHPTSSFPSSAPNPMIEGTFTLNDFTSSSIDSSTIIQMTLSMDVSSMKKIQNQLHALDQPTRNGESSTSSSSGATISHTRSREDHSRSVKRQKTSHGSIEEAGNSSTRAERRVSGTMDRKGKGKAIVPDLPKLKKIPLSTCKLPDARFGRSRRVLVPGTEFSLHYPLATVSMKGDVQFVDRRTRKWHGAFSIPNSDNKPFNVEDACVVDDCIVLAYGHGPFQLGVTRIPQIDTNSRPKLSFGSHRKWSAGLRALASIPGRNQVVTAGKDKAVLLWDLKASYSESASEDEESAGAEPSDISARHIGTLSYVATALAGRGTTVFVSRGKTLSVADIQDLPKGRKTGSSRDHLLANEIIHLHAPPGVVNRNLLFIETDHPRTQIGLYDLRKEIRESGEDVTFGYTYKLSSSSSLSQNTRYFRGSPDDTGSYIFVRGYPDGVVCLFDWRNPKGPVEQKSARRESGKPVFHAVFADFCLPEKTKRTRGTVLFGDHLDFLDMNLNACT